MSALRQCARASVRGSGQLRRDVAMLLGVAMGAPPPPPKQQSGRPRILVVEDDEDLLRMMYRMLSTIADVAMAADGEHALKILQSGTPPDLVITDWMMPRKDGLTLVKEMKLDERLKSTPAI